MYLILIVNKERRKKSALREESVQLNMVHGCCRSTSTARHVVMWWCCSTEHGARLLPQYKHSTACGDVVVLFN
jgi:hypothetical protein